MRKLSLLVPACALIVAVLVPGQAAFAEPTPAQLEEQIETKSRDLEKVVEQYNQLQEQLTGTKTEIDDLQKIIGPLQDRATQSMGRVGDIARTAYRTTGINGLTAVLTSPDAGQVLARLGTLQHLATGQQERIAEANGLVAKHTAARTALEHKLAEQDERLKTIKAQRTGIERELDKLNRLKVQVRGTSTSGSSSGYTGPIPQISGAAGVAVTFAYQAIGKPYVWAADGPNGYDCSGLTKAAWRAAGVTLAHYTVTQWNQTVRIGRGDLAPGDLVFYSGLGHVALYIGGGKVIHAPTFGDHVKISNLDMMKPDGYGRVR